jgi:hypothetical protein
MIFNCSSYSCTFENYHHYFCACGHLFISLMNVILVIVIISLHLRSRKELDGFC